MHDGRLHRNSRDNGGLVALRAFSDTKYRPHGPAGASDTVPGVRPASNPCILCGLLGITG